MPTGLQDPKKWRFWDFLSNRIVVKFLPPQCNLEGYASLSLIVRIGRGRDFCILLDFSVHLLLKLARLRSIPNRNTKTWPLSLTFFRQRRIWSFQVVILQRTAKKCTKNYNARAQPLFCSLNLLFTDVLVAVAVVFWVRSLVDDGGNYVTFPKLDVRTKIKKIITPHNELISLSRLCFSAIGSSKFVYF